MQAMLTSSCLHFTLSCWQASKRAELDFPGTAGLEAKGLEARGLEAQAHETNFDQLSESLRALSSGLASS